MMKYSFACWSCALLVTGLAWSARVGAETIRLKDGKTIDAKITKRTDQAVTIDWYGVAVTYWLDEIERIEEGQPHAAGQGTSQEALIEEVLRLSGVLDQLERMGREADASFDRGDERLAKLSPEERERLRRAIVDAFQPEALRRSAVETVGSTFDQPKLLSAREWLRSPLARAMTQLETAPSDRQAMEQFVAALEEAPPPEARLALIRRLEEATDATESLLRLSGAMVTGMGSAMETSGTLKPGEFADVVGRKREEYINEHRDEFEATVLAHFLFTYRTVSDTELEPYVQFWESELGRWFNQLAFDALTHAVETASTRMAEGILALVNDAKAKAAPAVNGTE